MSQQKAAYQPVGAYSNANIAQATVVQATVISTGPAAAAAIQTQVNSAAIRDFLANEHLWSEGMQDLVIDSFAKLPCRFFICDNSGSMMANDGKKINRSGISNETRGLYEME